MKKNLLSIVALIATALTASAQSTVTLHVDSLANGTQLTAEIGSTFTDQEPIATATLQNGVAVFNLPVSEPRMIDFKVKGNDGRLLHMMTNKGEKAEAFVVARKVVNEGITYWMSYTDKQKVYDSPTQAEYMTKIGAFKAYLDAYNGAYHDAFRNVYNQLLAAKDEATANAIRQTDEFKQMSKFEGEFFKMMETTYKKIFADNKDTFWSPLMQLDTYTFFTEENKEGYDMLSEEAKNSFYGQCLKEQVHPKGFMGENYAKFEVLDAKGKKTPSDKLVKGKKYMLIDFWASWCKPCRAEVPNLKDAYAKYSSKGLEIISISIDRSDKAWQKALTEENFPWPNGIDKSGIANAYKVQAIPAMFLVDVKSGKIIGENLRGEKLQSKLAELMK